MTEIVDLAWSDVYKGQSVRWATPVFIAYGTVIQRKGRSLTFYDMDLKQPRVIPDARWYFVRGKGDPRATEGLWVIDALPTMPEPLVVPEDPDDDWITVQAACESVRVDPKLLRRYIRRGKLSAHKDLEGRWQVHRSQFLEFAVDRGWL